MPRARVAGTGMSGIGQTIFPDDAKAEARGIALEDLATVLRSEGSKEGGVIEDAWEPIEENIPARIDELGSRLPRKLVADQINETTTHFIHLAPTADVKTSDRVELRGRTWAVLTKHERSGASTIVLEVKEI